MKKILGTMLIVSTFLFAAENIDYLSGVDEKTGEKCVVGFELTEDSDYVHYNGEKLIMRSDRNSRPQVSCKDNEKRYIAEKSNSTTLISICATSDDKIISVSIQSFSAGNKKRSCIDFN